MYVKTLAEAEAAWRARLDAAEAAARDRHAANAAELEAKWREKARGVSVAMFDGYSRGQGAPRL